MKNISFYVFHYIGKALDATIVPTKIDYKNRRFEFDLKTIPDSDRYDLQDKLLNIGLGEEFFVSLFPDDTDGDKRDDYSGIVKFVRIPNIQEFTHSYYRSSYIVEEA